MDRWISIAIAALVVTMGGCAMSVDVVDEPDEEAIEELNRYSIEEREVQFEAAGTDVYGTLTSPAGVDDAPGVVLVAGSGPTDRDWNNPMLPGDEGTAIELAERLGRAGIAVLRYDKRGTGRTALPDSLIWNDYLSEIEAAVNYLSASKEADAERIFLAGHSEGGTHALRVVSEQRVDVDGLMLLATAGRSTRQLVIDEVTEQLDQTELEEDVKEAEINSLTRALDAISQGRDVNSSQVSQIAGLASLVDALQQDQARDFAAELLGWDPIPRIRRIQQPVLIVHGLKDIRVDPVEDAQRLYEAAGENSESVQLALIEDADHVFKHQPVPTEELSQQHSLSYNSPARRLDDAALDAIANWVLEQQ